MENKLLKPIKSFWERPEGTPGMIGIALLVVGAGYLLLKNAAWLALAMANLTTAIFTGIGLFALVWLLSDKQVRMLIWYFYKGMIKKITSIFIEIDPIGIIKTYVDELRRKRRDMDKQLTKLKAEQGKLDRKIQDEKETTANLISKARVAKAKMGQKLTRAEQDRIKAQMFLHARKAGRRKNSTLKLTELRDKIKKLYKVMDKMYYYSGIMVDDTSDQVEILESERKAIHASYSVMKSAQAIIAGNSDESIMFEQAMQGIADDIGSKVGEMDRFMDLSQTFMDGVDLDNGVFESEGLAMLEEWEQADTMNFIEQGTVNYLQILDGPTAEPMLLNRDNSYASSPKKKKFFKE